MYTHHHVLTGIRETSFESFLMDGEISCTAELVDFGGGYNTQSATEWLILEKQENYRY